MMKTGLLFLSFAVVASCLPLASADIATEHRAWVNSMTTSHRRELQDVMLTTESFNNEFCPALKEKIEAAKEGTFCVCAGLLNLFNIRCTLPKECVTGSEFAVNFGETCGNSTDLTCFEFTFVDEFGNDGTVVGFQDKIKFDSTESAVDYQDANVIVERDNECRVVFRYNESEYGCNSCQACDGDGGYIIDCTNIQDNANLTTCGSIFSVFSMCPAGGAFTPSSDPLFRICFSGDTEVMMLKDGGTTAQAVPMKDLKLGDMIQVDGADKFEPIYSFGHYAPNQEATFLAISTCKQQVLEISPEHMVFLANGDAPVAASMIRRGDILKHAGGEETVVTSVKTVTRKSGVFAPFTKSGTIVVNNGIVASTYIAYQDQSEYFMVGSYQTPFTHQWMAHTFTSIHRLLLVHVLGNTDETYDQGISRLVRGGHESGQWLLKQPTWLIVLILVPALAVATVASLVEQCTAAGGTMMTLLVGAITIGFAITMHGRRNTKKMMKH